MSKLTSRKAKDGYYHFYWNGRDITLLWMDFFGGLTMEQENRCKQIFLKRYSKKLDKQFPPTPLKAKRDK